MEAISDLLGKNGGLPGGPEFVTTHWSAVSAAGDTDSKQSAAALEQICSHYWFPIYAYVRRQGHSPEDAQDLTQDFFARLLAKQYFRLADPNRGRFRTFLLTSLKHFLVNEWHRANRGKRGGGQRVLSLDLQETESRFQAEPSDNKSPDKVFDRQWALELLGQVLDQLQTEYAATERAPVFDALKPFLVGDEGSSSYAEIADRLGMTESNVKVTVHRLRRRYGELLKAEIGRTVDNPQAIEGEMRELFAALSG